MSLIKMMPYLLGWELSRSMPDYNVQTNRYEIAVNDQTVCSETVTDVFKKSKDEFFKQLSSEQTDLIVRLSMTSRLHDWLESERNRINGEQLWGIDVEAKVMIDNVIAFVVCYLRDGAMQYRVQLTDGSLSAKVRTIYPSEKQRVQKHQ